MNTGLFGSGAAPTPGNSATIQTYSFIGEATAATGVIAGNQYTVDVTYSSGSGTPIIPLVVIYDSLTSDIIAFGTSPVAFTAPTSGTYYTIPFADAFSTTFDPYFGCNPTLWSNVTPLPPPPNDLPCDVFVLNAEPTCTCVTFTNANATATPGVTPLGCARYLGGDVWFRTVIPASGIVSIDTEVGTVIDGGMAV